jgi:hypothetical protein
MASITHWRSYQRVGFICGLLTLAFSTAWVGCNFQAPGLAGATGTPTVTETATAIPSSTPTLTETALPTETETALPTLTPTPEPLQVTRLLLGLNIPEETDRTVGIIIGGFLLFLIVSGGLFTGFRQK